MRISCVRHSAELDKGKGLAVQAWALLPEEHGRPETQPDREGSRQHGRPEYHKGEGCQHEITESLGY